MEKLKPIRTSNGIRAKLYSAKTTFSSSENSSDSDIECEHLNNLKFMHGIRAKKSTMTKFMHSRERNIIYSSSESNSSDDRAKTKVIKEKSINASNSSPGTPRKGKLRSITVDVENITPTKQQKCENSSKKSPCKSLSPSSLFQGLDINCPSPESKSYKTGNNIYQCARKALYSCVPKAMPGRESELKKLSDFITNHLESKTSGSLYISGPPGTGKTATLSMILQRNQISKKLKPAYINCTGIKSPGAIYSKIILELDIKTNGRTEKDYIASITKYLTRSSRTVLLVLDEIDQLSQSSIHQRTLYTLFSFPSSYPLLLIGIANALDLTDRLLPRLQSRCSVDVKPQLLHFAPYTRPQIVTIFTERLREALGDGSDVFDKAALAMLAGKVAAMSGDVRKALDIGRRVVEMVEGQQALQTTASTSALKSIENQPSTCNVSPAAAAPATVNLQQVVQILNTVYGTSNNLSSKADHETFPLQQKIVICSLLLYLKYGQSKDITVGKLHEIYNRICTKKNVAAVDQAEFYALLGLVETKGIIRVFGKKERRLQKVSLEWDQGEVELALRDKEMIGSILQDDSCLKRI